MTTRRSRFRSAYGNMDRISLKSGSQKAKSIRCIGGWHNASINRIGDTWTFFPPPGHNTRPSLPVPFEVATVPEWLRGCAACDHDTRP